jgi:hypothetical protein
MLTADELIKQLSVDMTKGHINRLAATLQEQNFDLNKLIDLTLHPDRSIAFRAAWLLDTIILAAPELYADHYEYLALRMRNVVNESCKRHYTRIMMHLTSPGAPGIVRSKLQAMDLEKVVEQCFDWMIDPKIKVAVQVFAADTLFNLSSRYNWIADELINQMEFMMRNGGPAIQSKGKHILKKMRAKS